MVDVRIEASYHYVTYHLFNNKNGHAALMDHVYYTLLLPQAALSYQTGQDGWL